LALVLGRKRLAVLDVAPDVDVGVARWLLLVLGVWAVESHPGQSRVPDHAEG
jgi:hypothetical protein